jgi:hypothetical protein
LVDAASSRLTVNINEVHTILDLLFRPGLDQDGLGETYHEASAALSAPGATPYVGPWVAFFMRITDADLRALQRETGDSEAWAVFFRIFLVIADQIAKQHGVKVMLACRRHLTELAVRWMERSHGRRGLQRFIKNSGGEPNRRLAQCLRRRRRRQDHRLVA